MTCYGHGYTVRWDAPPDTRPYVWPRFGSLIEAQDRAQAIRRDHPDYPPISVLYLNPPYAPIRCTAGYTDNGHIRETI